MGARQVAGLRTAFHAQAFEQAPQVHFDRVLAGGQCPCDVAMTHAFVKHDRQLFLPF